MFKALSSTTIQIGLRIDTPAARYSQAGELILRYDLQNEISNLTRYLLPLILIYLTAVMCFLMDGLNLLAIQIRTEIAWLKLITFAILNNEAAYNGLAWQQT